MKPSVSMYLQISARRRLEDGTQRQSLTTSTSRGWSATSRAPGSRPRGTRGMSRNRPIAKSATAGRLPTERDSVARVRRACSSTAVQTGHLRRRFRLEIPDSPAGPKTLDLLPARDWRALAPRTLLTGPQRRIRAKEAHKSLVVRCNPDRFVRLSYAGRSASILTAGTGARRSAAMTERVMLTVSISIEPRQQEPRRWTDASRTDSRARRIFGRYSI